jgi:glycosyltransferase involved in cell wall biosynthesis
MRLCDYALYSILAFVYAVTDRDIDTVVTGTPPPFHLPTVYLLSVAVRARFVLDVRDLYPETAVALGVIKNRAVEWVYKQFEQWIWRRADALVVPSELMVEKLCEAGVPRDRVSIIHNAYNSARTSTDGLDVAVPRWDDEFIVAYTGGMGYAPDIPTILDAAARLRNQDVRFIFLGDGERKAEYQHQCERRGLDNCTFLQPVPRRKVGAYLDRADACVHALSDEDVWELALPNKLFEYMWHGKPVVFAGHGATAELIENAGCGVAVPPEDDAALADAIERLSTGTEVRSDMATAAATYMDDTHPRERLAASLDSVVV